MGSGMTEELATRVSEYIRACRRVRAGDLSTQDDEFSDACEAVDTDLICWDGLGEEGWTAEERALCVLMLEEQAQVQADPRDWVDMFFVTADAMLFKTATAAFGGQCDLLGLMLEKGDGPERLMTIVGLCAQLDVQPFRHQDVETYIGEQVLRLFADDDQEVLVRTWYDAKCRGAREAGHDRPGARARLTADACVDASCTTPSPVSGAL